jgi:enoyl-CoA hydratase/carnithine racemase
MAARGPIALRYAKEAVRRGWSTARSGAAVRADLTVILQTTEDRAEGVRFREKRKPEFKGR